MTDPSTSDRFHHPISRDDWPEPADQADAVFGRTLVPESESDSDGLQEWVLVRMAEGEDALSAALVRKKGSVIVGPSEMDAEQAATVLSPWIEHAQASSADHAVPDPVAGELARIAPIG